jgi:DNA recombination protein RmuC
MSSERRARFCYRARIFIFSPALLMPAIQVVQQMRRDERMREAADLIREEVMKLLEDVGRLGDRVRKLDGHFKNVNEDVRLAMVSLEKVEGRGARIRKAEIGPAAESAPSKSSAKSKRW